MIKFSSNHPKTCGRCNDYIYTFELRDNRDSGISVHLQCSIKSLHSASVEWINNVARIQIDSM